ncbi:MAG: hypothetical protein PVF25_17145 [Desulfobacterales bacterium]|jgi:hypothetical protein
MVKKKLVGVIVITFGFVGMLNAGNYGKKILLILQPVRNHSIRWLQQWCDPRY